MIIPTEEQEHLALMEWAQTNKICRKYLIHIPNGGSRHKAEAAKLKRMGVRAGVSDFFLPYPNDTYAGLWLELKRRKKSRISEEQLHWLYLMQKCGYAAKIAYGWEHGKEIIKEYLECQ